MSTRAIGRKQNSPSRYIAVGVFFTLCAYNLYSAHKSLIGSTIFSLDDVNNNNNGVAPASVLNNIINKNAVHDDQDVDKLFTDAPFLVVCNNIDISLRPMFDNFTVVRLLRRERPPPWNATVFLYGEHCKDHPYVQQAIKRRNVSPFLDFSSSPALEMIKRNNTNGWINGVHWPADKHLRIIHDRPAIIKVHGEVFWRMHYSTQSCNDVDFVVYREVETILPDCLTIHYLQGVSTSMMRGTDGESGFMNTTHILESRMPDRAQLDREKFCSFMVQYNSTAPVYMFNKTHYDIDALVRHVFFLQLSEYKPCERITNCPEISPYNAFKCTMGYKFHITMENSQVEGYVSEKLFNGALGGGVPIYFGANDIGRYVNDLSFIHCSVSKSVIEEMRSFYPRRPRPRPFLFNFSSTWPTEEEMLSWANGYLRPELEPCVKQVIELDEKDEEYVSVLNEPFILNHDIMSGLYPLRGVALAYNLLRSTKLMMN